MEGIRPSRVSRPSLPTGLRGRNGSSSIRDPPTTPTQTPDLTVSLEWKTGGQGEPKTSTLLLERFAYLEVWYHLCDVLHSREAIGLVLSVRSLGTPVPRVRSTPFRSFKNVSGMRQWRMVESERKYLGSLGKVKETNLRSLPGRVTTCSRDYVPNSSDPGPGPHVQGRRHTGPWSLGRVGSDRGVDSEPDPPNIRGFVLPTGANPDFRNLSRPPVQRPPEGRTRPRDTTRKPL